ncbi:MAG: hypothetical protein ACKV2T_11690 [Kofleriaceae bacterium]
MRSVLLIALAIMLADIADAKPLPAGLEIKLVKGKIIAKRGTTTVSLGSTPKLLGAELSADGKNIVIKRPGDIDAGEDPEVEETLALAGVEARLANATGMAFQVKKKHADAVGPFTLAVQHDPQPIYITNLLSALGMGKQLDEADKVIAAHGKRIAPWLAWRLAVDKELAALVDRPGTKALFPGGGKATSALRDKEHVAYSAAGFAAVEVYTGLTMGMPGESTRALAIVNLTTGEEVLRLDTDTTCAPPCKQSKYNAANKKRRTIADNVLARLGFQINAEPLVDTQVRDAPTTAKDGRKLTEDGAAIVVGKKQFPIPQELEVREIAFVPKAVVLVHKVQTSTNMDGTGTWEMEVTAIATP